MLKQFFKRLPAMGSSIVTPHLSYPFSPSVTMTPSFNQHRMPFQARLMHTPVFVKPYEHLNGTEHYVPTEKYIDEKLAQFLKGNSRFASQLEFKRYQGKELTYLDDSTLENEHRNWHYEQVHHFDIFDINRTLPDMEQGFFIEEGPRVHRCHLIEHTKTSTILGAIYFTVDVKNRTAYVNLIQTDNALRHNSLGKVLMHSAIYISLMYYCSQVLLVAVGNSQGFYEKMGFERRAKDTNDRYKLDFLDLSFESEAKFLSSFASIAPQCSIESLIEEVRMLHPINTKLVASPREIKEFIEERSLMTPFKP